MHTHARPQWLGVTVLFVLGLSAAHSNAAANVTRTGAPPSQNGNAPAQSINTKSSGAKGAAHNLTKTAPQSQTFPTVTKESRGGSDEVGFASLHVPHSEDRPRADTSGGRFCVFSFDFDGTIKKSGGTLGEEIPQVMAKIGKHRVGLSTASCSVSFVKSFLGWSVHRNQPDFFSPTFLASNASQFCTRDKGKEAEDITRWYGAKDMQCTLVFDDQPKTNRDSIESRGMIYQGIKPDSTVHVVDYDAGVQRLRERGCPC